MQNRINKLLHQLNVDLFEREEAIKLALLTTIAGESIFFLGPPGVAKSLISRRIKDIFKEGESFEYLMNRFSTPDEIFGPIAISKLKSEDKYERVVDKYLPSADIVFLDEIWKAGPSIQNALLTVINEKKYRNGQQEINIPLKGLISASNELPAKGEGLEALWDRFIVRCIVDNISDEENFNNFLRKSSIDTEVKIDDTLQITHEEYQQWQSEIKKIEIPNEVLKVIAFVRYNIHQYNQKEDVVPIYISDRRWKKIVRILQTSAFLNGRKLIDLVDCFLVTYTIWDEVEHIETVNEFVTKAIKEHGYSFSFDWKDFEEEVAKLSLDINNKTKVEKQEEYFVPKTHSIERQKYYKIKGFQQEAYIEKKDYDNLSSNFKGVNLLLAGLYGYNRRSYEVKLGNPNEIIVKENHYYYNYSDGSVYSLEVDIEKKKKIETKRPDSRIIASWDKKIGNLQSEVEAVISQIKEYEDKNLKGLVDNIFVPKHLAELAKENLKKTHTEYQLIKENIKGIKANYENL